MVRPAAVWVQPANGGHEPVSAGSRAAGAAERQQRVLGEFDALAEALARAGVQVIVADDTAVRSNRMRCSPITGSVFIGTARSCYTRCSRPTGVGAARGVDRPSGSRRPFRITRTVDLSHREAEANSSRAPAAWSGPRRARRLCLPVAAHRSRCARRVCAATGLRTHDLRCARRRRGDLPYECLDGGRHPFRGRLRRIDRKFAAPRRGVLEARGHRSRDRRHFAATQMREFAGNLLELERRNAAN
jgi:hypothetical protein